MQATTIGLDLAKSVFQVHGVDARGRVVVRKRLARAQVLVLFANLPRCLIGLEACAGAHDGGRELTRLGPKVRLMPPPYVKAYVKTNKHAAADAEGCCARRSAPTTKVGAGSQARVQRPGMRFVPGKSEGQQALLRLHRVRDQLIGQRTAMINALRGHLAEFGIVAAPRQAGLRQLLALLGDLEDDRIPPRAREVLHTRVVHLRELEERSAELDRRLVALTRTDPICRAGGRPGDRHGVRRPRARGHQLPLGPSSRGLARPGPQAARPRRQAPPARPEQARRRLSAPPADPRRPRPG
jgi:transposase